MDLSLKALPVKHLKHLTQQPGETLAVVSEAGREDIHKAVVAARMALTKALGLV